MATFHVAPDGDDSAAGTLAAPFRTFERARSAVRSVKWAQTGDIVVLFRGGTYFVPRQVLLDHNDSGINGHQVVYRSYPGERPVFVGGLPVTGWEREDDSVYRTAVPGLKEGLVPLTQLFEGERRAWPARHPNDGYLEAESRARTAITYRPGDLNPPIQ